MTNAVVGGDHGAMSTGDHAASERGGARTTHRRGRMSAAKRTTLAQLGPRWFLDPTDAVTAAGLERSFGRAAPRLLDIGVGGGEATRQWADEQDGYDVVAIEVHRPGIARLLVDLEGKGPPNVRVVEGDVTGLVADAQRSSYHGVRVLFPDPWPKRRHVNRRLVEPGFVRRVADLLVVGGWLHLATDWDDYADHMRRALATEDRLEPVVDATVGAPDGHRRGVTNRVEIWSPRRPFLHPLLDTGEPSAASADANPSEETWRSARPTRPVTAYERRGLDAGRTITDLVAHRRAG